MKRLRKPTRKQRRSRLTLEINCLTKIWTAGRLNYPQIAALKLPRGSGAIESLIRQGVQSKAVLASSVQTRRFSLNGGE